MKRSILFITLILLMTESYAQKPAFSLSQTLYLDTGFVVEGAAVNPKQKQWVGTACDDVFYACSSVGFQSEANGYQCELYAVNLKDYTQTKYLLSFPDDKKHWEKDASWQYISCISVSGDRLLLTLSNVVFMYERKNNKFVFIARKPWYNVKESYLYKRKIYLFSEDITGRSCRWYSFSDLNDEKGVLLHEWDYKAAFLCHFTPNRYRFMTENKLYYISPGEKYVCRYTLDGKFIDSVYCGIAQWNDFPEELLKEVNALPCGMERLSGAMKQRYQQYSFIRSIDVLSDSLWLLGINLGDANYAQRYAVMRMQLTPEGWKKDILTACDSDTSLYYVGKVFPVYYQASELVLMDYACRGKVVQLLQLPDVEDYQAKSAKQVGDETYLYFKNHDPVVKLRVQSLRPMLQFHNYDNEELGLDHLPHDKVVLLVNRQPQCSTCQRTLLQYFSSFDSTQVSVAVLLGEMDSYLERRQMNQKLATLTEAPFIPLYNIRGRDYGELNCKKGYPEVLLWQREFGFVGFYDTEQIFTADYNQYEFSESFLKAVNDFLTR